MADRLVSYIGRTVDDCGADADADRPAPVPWHSDLAIGDASHRSANVVRRSPKRGGDVALVQHLPARGGCTHAADAQRRLTAVRAAVVRELLPDVRDEEWFFETPSARARASRRGIRIHECPSLGRGPDSRVHIASTAAATCAGVASLAAGTVRLLRLPGRRFLSPATLAYVLLYCPAELRSAPRASTDSSSRRRR